ncbi:Claudin-10A [Cricetulus griseus]|uniref:Claudin n=1 Tax=Cricetulus griseus TaxID=10029 RepID=G3GS81_CRIGR|nr:Claudin-10A [Cricetulus griseus]
MASTALEIIAFTVSISGWVLVSSTLPTDYWKVSTIDGTVITTATYFANLWKMCVTDSTGVANCKDFPSMLALDGLCSMTGCSLYANKITTEFFDPLFMEQKYELGAALFIGWAGASLCIIGGVIFCFSISDNNKTPRMGYTYNGPTSVMSSRTKYQGGEGDFKTTSPSKQFDKNAYV